MDRLNFNHFYYFYIVARIGSIKEAALKLHVSQPTISDQIKLLEEYLCVKLFERKGRNLVLSESGEKAMTYAQKIFDLENEMTLILREGKNFLNRSVNVGVTHFMSSYFLHEMISPLFKNSTTIVNIKEGERRNLLFELEARKIDIIYTDNTTGLNDNFRIHKVGQNKTFVVAHKKYNKLKKSFPKSLNEIPFFNYSNQSLLRNAIDLYFLKNQISPQLIGEGDDIDILEYVTREALAFTIVPEVSKNRFLLNENIIILGEVEELQTEVFAILRADYIGDALKLINS